MANSSNDKVSNSKLKTVKSNETVNEVSANTSSTKSSKKNTVKKKRRKLKPMKMDFSLYSKPEPVALSDPAPDNPPLRRMNAMDPENLCTECGEPRVRMQNGQWAVVCVACGTRF